MDLLLFFWWAALELLCCGQGISESGAEAQLKHSQKQELGSLLCYILLGTRIDKNIIKLKCLN